MMHLFKSIRYELSGQEIENIMYPGQATVRYPTVDYNISFLAQKFSRVYGDAAEFRAKFFNMDDLVSNLNINPSYYRALYPLFFFDVSDQSEKIKYSTTVSKLRCILARMYLWIPKSMLLLLAID